MSKPLRALILGGNRFFGKRLVRRLLDRDAEITLLNRGALDDGFGPRVRRIQLDRRELDRDHAALGDATWDVVFDQCCYDATEAEGACRAFEGRTPRVIFTSSQSVYGPGFAAPESAFDARAHGYEPRVGTKADYSEAKRQAEAAYTRNAKFALTCMRFPIVLGEDDYTGRLKWHVERVASGKPMVFPNPTARMSFIHAADAAALLETLARRPLDGPVNAGARDPLALSQLIDQIEKRVDRLARISSPELDAEGKRKPTEANSPFGVEADWTMATDRLQAHGIEPAPIANWLPGLIDTYARGTAAGRIG